jgi:transposase
MMVIGVDPHKRTHTAVAVSAVGELADELTIEANKAGFARLIRWARKLDPERVFALEDCRQVSGRLERFLVARGERAVRVPPKLMERERRSQRTRGKSDPIDALAVARAALRNRDLPQARLAGPERELKLLLDHREHLVNERTRDQNRLRWHLHDLDPTLEPPKQSLSSERTLQALARRLARREQTTQLRIARELVRQIRDRVRRERALQAEITALVRQHAPALLELPGCGPLTAAKLVAEVAGAERFRSDAQLAMHAGAAPLDASSGNQQRHRLNRTGNRQLNCALHRIAVTQARCHPPARAYLERRTSEGKTRKEALRALKRHLARTVHRTLTATAHKPPPVHLDTAPFTPCLT